jgi:hypothetical protein
MKILVSTFKNLFGYLLELCIKIKHIFLNISQILAIENVQKNDINIITYIKLGKQKVGFNDGYLGYQIITNSTKNISLVYCIWLCN